METMNEIEDRWMGEARTGSGIRITRARCRVCDESIIETKETVPAMGELVLGGRSDYAPAHTRTRYYCSGCGICYNFIREEAIQ